MDIIDATKGYINAQDIVSPSASGEKFILLQEKGGDCVGKFDLTKSNDDFVDLGLPSGRLWSRRNMGAVEITDLGWYLAWGSKHIYENASARGAEWSTSGFNSSTYGYDPAHNIKWEITGLDDAAHLLLGGGWHMPKKKDYEELFNSANTTMKWVKDYLGKEDVNGILFSSRTNHNEMFLPASGYYQDMTLTNKGTYGYYWLPQLYMDVEGSYATCVSITVNSASGSVQASTDGIQARYHGVTLRAVI